MKPFGDIVIDNIAALCVAISNCMSLSNLLTPISVSRDCKYKTLMTKYWVIDVRVFGVIVFSHSEEL